MAAPWKCGHQGEVVCVVGCTSGEITRPCTVGGLPGSGWLGPADTAQQLMGDSGRDSHGESAFRFSWDCWTFQVSQGVWNPIRWRWAFVKPLGLGWRPRLVCVGGWPVSGQAAPASTAAPTSQAPQRGTQSCESQGRARIPSSPTLRYYQSPRSPFYYKTCAHSF